MITVVVMVTFDQGKQYLLRVSGEDRGFRVGVTARFAQY